MKNRTTQNRTLDSVTRQENEALDENLKTLNRILETGKKSEGNAYSVGQIAVAMYHVIYPRTVPAKRHFVGRQKRAAFGSRTY